MRNFTLFKIMFALIVLLIISTIVFKAGIIIDAKNHNKTIYQIEVNNYNQVESYTTTDYTRDKETGCIRFKDEFGIKHTVCNNYSITEY